MGHLLVLALSKNGHIRFCQSLSTGFWPPSYSHCSASSRPHMQLPCPLPRRVTFFANSQFSRRRPLISATRSARASPATGKLRPHSLIICLKSLQHPAQRHARPNTMLAATVLGSLLTA